MKLLKDPRVSLLCPTKGRPEQAERLLLSFLNTKQTPSELLFCLQYDDERLDDYKELFLKHNFTSFIETTSWFPTTQLWNILSQKSNADIQVLMGDDVVIETPGWDKIFIEYSKKYTDGIYCLTPLDGINQPGSCPHPILSKKWVDTLGYFVPPCFMHRYIDTWIATIAQKLNRFEIIHEVLFDHKKYETISDKTGKTSRTWLANDQYVNSITKKWYENDLELLKKVVDK